MRTTLTLDDDVAVVLSRLREERGLGLKDLINGALRAGLPALEEDRRPRRPFRTRAVDLGPCLLGSVDNVTEALAVAEGEGFR